MIGVAASAKGTGKGRKAKRSSPATRRASMASALALMVFAACIDNAAPAGAASPTPHQAAKIAEKPAGPVVISPVRDTPEREATIFSDLLARHAKDEKLPLLGEGGTDYTLRGALGAGQGLEGAYLIAVIDLHGKGDIRLHRVVTEARTTGHIPQNANPATPGDTVWRQVRPGDLERLAAESAARLARWVEANREAPAKPATPMVAARESGDGQAQGLVTGSIGPSLPLAMGGPTEQLADASAFRIEVAPAPGDGDRALTAAMEKALNGRLKETAKDIPGGPYKVKGDVVTASRNDGLTEVSIRWVLTGPKGNTLGEVRQTRAVSAASIAGRWGNLADQAANAAADGIMKLITPAPAAKAAQG